MTIRVHRRCLIALPLALLGCAASDARARDDRRFDVTHDPAEYLRTAQIADGPFTPLSAATKLRLDSALTSASALAGGDVSVAAIHVESGERYTYDAQRAVFLGESIKLPVLLSVLRQVDAGALRIRDSVRLVPGDARPTWMGSDSPRGSGIRLSLNGPTTVAFERLLNAAADSGDLTAVDALFNAAGGPKRINDDLRALGVRSVRIDRSIADQILDYVGVEPRPVIATESESSLRYRWQSVPTEIRRETDRHFHDDVRDRASAEALVGILVRVARGDLLSDSSRALLVTLLRMPSSTQHWLTTALPPSSTYLHFGTHWLGPSTIGASNEFAIVMLPGGRGRMALAVTAANTTAGNDSVKLAFQSVAQAAYTAFALK